MLAFLLGMYALPAKSEYPDLEIPPEDILDDSQLDGVPLDGGVISLIIAAGVGYFFHKNKKKTGLNE